MTKKTLIRNGTVLSMDPSIGDLVRGDVLIEGERIVAVKPRIEADDATVIEAEGMIVLPGLVQAHIHMWQTALRALGGDWAGSDYYAFFHATIAPRYTPEDTFIGTLVGALHQIDAGTTTIFEWCHNNATPAHTDAAVDALFESGVRAIFGHGTVKPRPKPGDKPFSEIPHPIGEIKRLRTGRFASDDGLVSLAMAILGPDYSTIEVCRHDFRAARDFGLMSSAHVWGRPNRLVKGGYRTIAAEGLLGPDHNIVHGNYIEDDELKVIVDAGASATSTAAIELRNHVREPLSGRVWKLGGKPSIGVDSEVSASGDMFGVMRAAIQMQRIFDNQRTVEAIERNVDSQAAEFARKNLQVIGTGGSMIEKVSIRTREVLEWATIGNARALQLDHKIGSLTPGKQADIILVRTDSLNMLSTRDPVQALVYFAQNHDVDTVMVAGRLLKANGRLTYRELDRRKRELLESAATLAGEAQPAATAVA